MKHTKVLLNTALLLFASFTTIAKNADNCPQGEYLGLCDGCTYNDKTKIIRCESCAGEWGPIRQTTTINTTSCKANEEVTTANNGTLMCNPRNTNARK